MTTVHLLYGSPAPDGTTPPVVGTLVWTPTRQRVQVGSPDTIIAPVGFRVPLKNGVTDIVVAPTAKNWAWRVDILIPGAPRTTTHVAVPDVAEIDFTDLVVVDPTTLQPKAKPDPIWYSWVDGLALTTANAEAAAQDAKLAAQGSETAAISSQNSAANSATTATEKAAEATEKATQAGTSAFNAASSAAAALGHKNDAEAAETGALAAESNALLYRDGANIARTASESARDASVSAKNASEAARDLAQAANAETVRTGVVNAEGHLILTRTDETTEDAGKVILPTTLTVGEVITGPGPETIVGPQGPPGPKGDPGGLTFGPILGASDLNNIRTMGYYHQLTTNGTLALNYPVAGITGVLLVTTVFNSTDRIMQEFTPTTWAGLSGSVFYRRSFELGTGWKPWRAYSSSRVDQTAGRVMYQWDEVNNRDQLIYGDTGWRNISDLLINGWTIGTGNISIRRVGNQVTWRAWSINGSAATAPTLCSIPAGFGFEAYSHKFAIVDGVSFSWVQVHNTSGITVPAVVPTAFQSTFSVWSYPTVQAWPTTLPGIASGSIPNV